MSSAHFPLVNQSQTAMSLLTFRHTSLINLDQNNYLNWKSQVIPTLKGLELLGYVDGTTLCPSEFRLVAPIATSPSTDGDNVSTEDIQDPATQQFDKNPAHTTWIRQDQLLLSWLLSSLTEPILARVINCVTSAQLWAALARMHASQTQARSSLLKMQLQTTKKGDMSMSDYIQKMQTISDNLQAACSPVTNAELVSYILFGLLEIYDSVYDAIYARGVPIEVEELSTLLITMEAKMSQKTSVTIQANVASKQNGSPYQRNYRPRQSSSEQFRLPPKPKSYNYGRDSYMKTQQKPKVYCQICSKPGHTALKCYQRFNQGNSSDSKSAYFASAATVSDPSWYVDSGASNHLTSDLQNLTLHNEYSGNDHITVGNGHTLGIDHTGKSFLPISNTQSLILDNVLHVPKIKKNLLSVSQFTLDNNVYLEFHPFSCYVKNQQGQILLRGSIDQGIYKLEPSAHSSNGTKTSLVVNKDTSFAMIGERTSAAVWHQRLGHPSSSIVHKVLASSNVPVSDSKSNFICSSCQMSKSHKLPFQESQFVSSSPLELIMSDVCGPSPIISNRGFRYYVHFIDHFTKYIWIFPMKHKSEVQTKFNTFRALVENQFDRKIKILQSDWGGEYRNLSLLGIHHRVSCPHTPEQNGGAERRHRQIVETGLTLLAASSMPLHYWDDAFVTAVYLINRLPTKTLQFCSPFQKVILLIIKGINVYMLKQEGCTSLAMLSSMSIVFPLQPCPLYLLLVLHLLHLFLLYLS